MEGDDVETDEEDEEEEEIEENDCNAQSSISDSLIKRKNSYAQKMDKKVRYCSNPSTVEVGPVN